MKLIMENWRKFLAEAEKRPIHIFFDMDGVLVDFAGSLAKTINENLDKVLKQGSTPEEVHGRGSSLKLLKKIVESGVTSVTPDELEAINYKKDTKAERTKPEKLIGNYIMALVSKDKQIWLDMEKVRGADKMVSMAQQIAGPENVYVLSSPVGPKSEEAKKQWISRYFPDLSKRIILTGEKGVALQNMDILKRKEIPILIDDRTKYVNQFKAAGGQTIHHKPAGEAGVAATLSALKGPWSYKEPRTAPGQQLEAGFGLILKLSPPANIDQLIQTGQQKYLNVLPEGEEFTKIDKSHVTLISGKKYKELSDEQKQDLMQKLTLPEAIVDERHVFLAAREMEGRKTLYVKIQNSDVLNQALQQTIPDLPNKYMHMSIANVHGGNPFKSVGNINKTDEGQQKNIVPAIQQKKKKKPPQQKKGPPTRVEIPNEIKPLGNILRGAMKSVAAIYPNLKRMKDNERALQGIVNGVLRKKLGLDDSQITAILKTL